MAKLLAALLKFCNSVPPSTEYSSVADTAEKNWVWGCRVGEGCANRGTRSILHNLVLPTKNHNLNTRRRQSCQKTFLMLSHLQTLGSPLLWKCHEAVDIFRGGARPAFPGPGQPVLPQGGGGAGASTPDRNPVPAFFWAKYSKSGKILRSSKMFGKNTLSN